MVSQTTPVLFTGFSAARKLDIWIPQKSLWKSTLGVSPSYSVNLFMDTTAFRAETTQQLVQALPDNPRATAWHRQYNLILNSMFSLHLTAVHFPSSEVIWISLIKATSFSFVTVLTWNSQQAGIRPHSPQTAPTGSFLFCSSICFCSRLPKNCHTEKYQSTPGNDLYYLSSLKHLGKKSASVVKEQINDIRFIQMN